jgi:hypothetical protein
MKTGKRIILEPDLEAIAGGLDPIARLELAAVYARWARQLKVSARALRPRPKTAPKLPHPGRAWLN